VQVVNMGLRLAEVVLRHQLPDRAMLENLIRETLNPISDLRGVRVRVSAAELAALKNPAPAELPKPPFLDQVEVVADPILSDGDLMIESRNGIFDARLSERLVVLADKLKERMKNSDANSQVQST
jgi:flagellar biosynthesis/type III secretory pathway protein FliH